MALLFNDPLAFLPPANSGLRMLFQNWNQSSALGPPPPVGTFNQPQESAIQQQRQLDQLDEIKTRMENLQVTQSAPGGSDRSIHSRRIRPTANESSSQISQMLEPIPVMDLDHPLNSWMLPTNRKPEHLGPIASKNNSDWPVLPRFTVSALSNGTLVQIPVSPPSIAILKIFPLARFKKKKKKKKKKRKIF